MKSRSRSFWEAFLDGMGRVLDIAGVSFEIDILLNDYRRYKLLQKIRSRRPIRKSIEEAFEQDRQAMANDWQTIGDDMRTAIRKFEEENDPNNISNK